MSTRLRNSLGFSSLALAILMIFGVSLNMNWVQTLDHLQNGIYQYVANHSWAEKFFQLFTKLGNGKEVFALLLVLLIISFFTTYRKYGVALVVFVSISAIFNDILKGIFQRERPSLIHLVDAHGLSFPSGHAMNSIVLYGFIAYIILQQIKRYKVSTVIIFSVIIVLIAVSRVALGVHYVSDVLTGMLIGFSLLIAQITIFEKYILKNKAKMPGAAI